MKRILISLIFALPIMLMAQVSTDTTWMISELTYDENGYVTLQEVVPATGTNAELYTRARTWFSETYVDAKEVIQMDSPETGKIIGKGISNTYNLFKLPYTITLELKEGRYRYTIALGNYHASQTMAETFSEKSMNHKWKSVRTEMNNLYQATINEINMLVGSLRASMVANEEGDW